MVTHRDLQVWVIVGLQETHEAGYDFCINDILDWWVFRWIVK